MKRHLLLILSIASLSVAAMAQNDMLQTRVKAIREAYQKAQNWISEGKKESQARNEFSINATYMEPGAGQTVRKVDFHFRIGRYDEPPRLYLIRESFNIAARKFYREYLYDAENGEPMFFYTKYDDYEKGTVEQRFYYYNRRSVHTIPENLGEGFEHLRYFDRYKNLFNEYMSIQNGEN